MRKIITVACLLFLMGMSFTGCSQSRKEHSMHGIEYAKKELQESLKNKSLHNVVSTNKLLVSDSSTAVQVLEPIIFHIYGKEDIVKQRPYEINLIDNYWVMSGTLPKGWLGGVFMIIMDAHNCQIIRITHGK
ncbi:YbbC/YhhH family protein [Hymenobacter properus]|uniref:YbbC/YhhH family protein n=1 Tax=Hymenobacter properus TaxID=2791026 RepID=A0A931BBM5_9BACT|nr:YbbC/YhhH family protein [Hymenobacter properus]MBF9140769.1 YbbC/YhhH family protein [Hymenobacter properus]MBR7719578.1 YbbC/YhhH family protein [Microvirga sp. SRT04]